MKKALTIVAVLTLSLLIFAGCKDEVPTFPTQGPRFVINGEANTLTSVYTMNRGQTAQGYEYSYFFFTDGLTATNLRDSARYQGTGYQLELRITSPSALEIANTTYTYALQPAAGAMHFGFARKIENGQITSESYSIVSGELTVEKAGDKQDLEGTFISTTQASMQVFYDEEVQKVN